MFGRYCQELHKLENNFDGLEYLHILRGKKEVTGELAKLGSCRATVPTWVFLQKLQELTISKALAKANKCSRFVCSSASARNCKCSTSSGVFSRYRIYIFLGEEEYLSCLRLTKGVTPMSTTRLYRGYVNWG
jgi:hypothetical protein